LPTHLVHFCTVDIINIRQQHYFCDLRTTAIQPDGCIGSFTIVKLYLLRYFKRIIVFKYIKPGYLNIFKIMSLDTVIISTAGSYDYPRISYNLTLLPPWPRYTIFFFILNEHVFICVRKYYIFTYFKYQVDIRWSIKIKYSYQV